MITREFLKKSPFAHELYEEAARLAAAEAVDALWGVYWAHSFDGQLLVNLLAAVMVPIINGAIPLEVHAYDEATEQPLTPERIYPPATLRDRAPGGLAETSITEWYRQFYDTP